MAADEKTHRFEYLLPSGHSIELPFDIWQYQAAASRRVVKRDGGYMARGVSTTQFRDAPSASAVVVTPPDIDLIYAIAALTNALAQLPVDDPLRPALTEAIQSSIYPKLELSAEAS